MKKNLFETIRKIDFILIFITALLVIIFLGVEIILNLYHSFHYTQPTIEMPLVQSSNEENNEIKQYISFEQKIDDVYIFSIKSTAINADNIDNEDSETISSYSNIIKSYSKNDGVTNLIFIKENNNTETKLFKKDVFIYKYCLKNNDEYHSLCCNVYAVVKADNDNDQKLTNSDNIFLYVSNYDGSNLTEISKSIISFNIISKNEFIYTEHDGKNLTYFTYNVATQSKTLLKTVEQPISEKQIHIY